MYGKLRLLLNLPQHFPLAQASRAGVSLCAPLRPLSCRAQCGRVGVIHCRLPHGAGGEAGLPSHPRCHARLSRNKGGPARFSSVRRATGWFPAQRTDPGPMRVPGHQPARGARLPHAAGTPQDAGEILRAADRHHASEFADLDRSDADGQRSGASARAMLVTSAPVDASA
jgi:hypothetical protein